MLFQFRLVALYDICCFHFHCVMDVWLETVVYVFNGSKVLIFSDAVFRILFRLVEQSRWPVLTIVTHNRSPEAVVFGPVEEM